MEGHEMDGLIDGLSQMVMTVLEIGGGYPLLVSAVALNGSMFYGRYDDMGDAAEFTPLAEHTVDDTFSLPVNIMLIDADGDAYRGLISREGAQLLH